MNPQPPSNQHDHHWVETYRIDLKLALLPSDNRRSPRQPRGRIANLVAHARLRHAPHQNGRSRLVQVVLERSNHLLTDRQQEQILDIVHIQMGKRCAGQGRQLAPRSPQLTLEYQDPSHVKTNRPETNREA